MTRVLSHLPVWQEQTVLQHCAFEPHELPSGSQAGVTPGELLWVQVVPLEDVTMVPTAPTATSCVPDQATADRKSVVPETREVQLAPSVEVTMPPLLPTATNCAPVQTIP